MASINIAKILLFLQLAAATALIILFLVATTSPCFHPTGRGIICCYRDAKYFIFPTSLLATTR